MTDYKAKTWFCGDQDLDNALAAVRNKIAEIVDINVELALKEFCSSKRKYVHAGDSEHAIGEFHVSFSEFETRDGDVFFVDINVDEIVDSIVEFHSNIDDKVCKDAETAIYFETWARRFEKAASRLRASFAAGIEVQTPDTPENIAIVRRIRRDFISSVKASGLADDLIKQYKAARKNAVTELAKLKRPPQ